jgi:hypothetical protein
MKDLAGFAHGFFKVGLARLKPPSSKTPNAVVGAAALRWSIRAALHISDKQLRS